jgi:Flp pilus assembly protein TadD
MRAGLVLDLLGVLEGTDKSSHGHGYLQYYEEILRHLRDEHFTLIEIGVFGGGSLRCWKAYFPHAHIIGVDINPDCTRYAEDRIQIEIGSQDDPEFLDRLVAKNKPLVVIDDGSHLAHHMISTFERLFPALLPGGYYFFEDAYMHFGENELSNIGLSRIPLKEYCANLAVSRVRGWLDPAQNHGVMKYIFEQTASVAYIWRAILVQKRLPPPAPDEVLRTAERIVSASGLSRHWIGLANLALAAGEAILAETAARNAIEAGERNWPAFLCLVKALEQQGRLEEAIAEAEQALISQPNAVKLLEWIAHAFGNAGDHATAIGWFQRALALDPEQMWFHLALSRCYLKQGEIPRALEFATSAERLAKGSPEAGDFTTHKERVSSLMASGLQ